MANFVPKYAPQAASFGNMITTVNTALGDTLQKANGINSKIPLDSNSEDALALNTIIFTEKIKTEINNKIESNDTLSSAISKAAKKFDEEDYEDFLAAERLRLAQEEARRLAEEKKTTTEVDSTLSMDLNTMIETTE